MMFMMPIPPTSSDTPAMLASSAVIVCVASLRTLAISSIVRTMKSSGSPGDSLWRVRNSVAIRSATTLTWPASAAATSTLLMNVTPRSFFITVVYGTKRVSSRS